MRQCHYTGTAQAVQAHAVHLIQTHLQLPDSSQRCTASLLLAIVFVAAARRTSGFAACQRLAIDLHLVPYSGEPLADPKELYRGPAKPGTNSFHADASA